MKASTNSFFVARRLLSLGYDAKVLVSDIANGLAPNDCVNDRIDAYNIALAYARRGEAKTVVFIPSAEYHEYCDTWFGYRNAQKDVLRWKVGIWSFCNRHGLNEPVKAKTQNPDRIRKYIECLGWPETRKFQIDTMLQSLEFAESMKKRAQARIGQIVAGNESMRRAMSVLGIGALGAFALMAFVENIERFGNPKKLVRYIGLNPTVNKSGKDDGNGGLSYRGRGDLRSLLVEAANSALRHGSEPMHRWARLKIAAGKPRNLILCALARKMVVALWHSLMGHPIPCREPEICFRRKLTTLAQHLSEEELKKLGFSRTAAFVEPVVAPLYAHLPQKSTSIDGKGKIA